MAVMRVELVSAERRLWSGEAEMVVARTVDGEIGVLPGHAPVLAALPSGILRILVGGDDEVVAAVHGGFLSVSAEGVSVLADIAELGPDVDVERARSAYGRASGAGEDDEEARAALRRAAARLRAAGQAVPA